MLCGATITSACSDSISPSTGTLAGTVVLQDSWANRLADFSGVMVSVDGMSTGAVTDAGGAWHIDDVTEGRHDITFKKATFGTVLLAGATVSGPATTAPAVTMAVTPWQQAIVDSVYAAVRSGKNYYVVDGHISAPFPANAIFASTVAYFGKTSSVSPDPTSFDLWNSSSGRSSTFSIALLADAVRATFPPGSRMFVTTYLSAVACTCYPDSPSFTGKPLFSNTGPRANVVELTIQ
jgi:hypothetical protein